MRHVLHVTAMTDVPTVIHSFTIYMVSVSRFLCFIPRFQPFFLGGGEREEGEKVFSEHIHLVAVDLRALGQRLTGPFSQMLRVFVKSQRSRIRLA